VGRTLSDTQIAPHEGLSRNTDPLAAPHRELLDSLRSELLAQAPLFEDPFAYGAGVLDTLKAVSAALTRGEPGPHQSGGRHEGNTR
jgi:hypothetical protein